MAGGFAHIIMKKNPEKKFVEKQSKMDDILVFDDDLPKNCAFTFVDFAPTLKLIKEEGLKSVCYSELIEFANKWLRRTGCWNVVSCETLPALIELVFTLRGEIECKQILTTYSITEDPSQDAAVIHKKLTQTRVPVQFRVRLLRLWIKRFEITPTEELPLKVPQIQYEDFVPKRLNDTDFENIDSVVERVNQSIRNGKIPGHIITIQTLACNAEQDWTIDEDSSQANIWIGKIVFILRIFYVLGDKHEEDIGLVDFIPECFTGGGIFKRPKFESQSQVLAKASKWLSHNKDIKFCNFSSIDVKIKSNSIDSKQMSITRETGDFIRFMRITYIKLKDSADNSSVDTPIPPPIYLENKAFVLHKSYSEVKKTIADFMSREEWTAQHQHKWGLMNCETVFVISPNAMKSSMESNSDQSFQSISASKLSINRNLFFALKLYYDVGVSRCDQTEAETALTSRSQSCHLM